MTKSHLMIAAAMAAPLMLGANGAQAATAKKAFGDPITFAPGTTFDPMLDARVRWEDVDATTKAADAETLRIRAGFEIKNKPSHLAFLVEGEGTLALGKHYSAFAFAAPSHQYRPAQAVIPDPENVELNRIQIQYATKPLTVTLGRQRINLDDQRFVGSVGWRQNEQTFDAVRAEYRAGPLSLDATYARRQRSIFGNDGGPRVYYTGSFYFLGGGVKTKYANVKAFAYLLDYDPTGFTFQTNSSQTYGVRATGVYPLNKAAKLTYAASWATQQNYGSNPFRYDTDYLAGELGLDVKGIVLTGGYEKLGSDAGATGGPRAMQTPMATLHKFNGWADMFLTTPANGLEDTYVGVSGKLPKLTALPGFTYALTYHWFGSDIRSQKYGDELNASIGIKTGKVSWLVKYADYRAQGFGANTKKFWLQAEYAF
ncbi:alginate export family protein [Novosphingobium sp. FSY-8]|uniref:Alginate export family protein n=1 Tax=Novosphingobium ovatum TaxID=1908523 RepID=A0ABW9XDP2_9SPHN|nr:alginate export family protein [Novosphingobium ovatum]NBC36654.1 alginate export family protein [Novosphingobium ovatum]